MGTDASIAAEINSHFRNAFHSAWYAARQSSGTGMNIR